VFLKDKKRCSDSLQPFLLAHIDRDGDSFPMSLANTSTSTLSAGLSLDLGFHGLPPFV